MTTPRLFVSSLAFTLLATLPGAAQGRPWHASGGAGAPAPRPAPSAPRGSLSGGPSASWHGGGPAVGRPGGGVSWHGAPYRVLPRGYATYYWGGHPYYYASGIWYRPWRGAYLGWYPPIGICLDVLPPGYSTFWWGSDRYYVYENVYYRDAPAGGYMVAEPPEGRERAAEPRTPTPDEAALDALLITPKEGQSVERMKADRADAKRYALRKSGFDPAYSDPGDPGTPRARRAYLRALREYLETRGYEVH
ncbi:DUF6515 family protein [Mesoterricola sediminis]|uniref:YXWGXW repeat-containing protein n=1 Tax=Mesoterricola sediminis TaxID=2927980 RepID=A0AA48KC76_9BACT|nr:DUF6515 family protein [Mesoterricola sediminis]BDU76864.1 hypothetical protein METESE_18220 [Mesoterricola sediminis]